MLNAILGAAFYFKDYLQDTFDNLLLYTILVSTVDN